MSEQAVQSGHERANSQSAALCDTLFAELEKRVPGLETWRAQVWCSCSPPGGKRFAFVRHKKTPRIEVWFSGDSAGYAEALSFEVIPRPDEKMRGGFGPTFKASFGVTTMAQAVEASEFLFQVSYPASASKSPCGRRPRGIRFVAAQEERR